MHRRRKIKYGRAIFAVVIVFVIIISGYITVSAVQKKFFSVEEESLLNKQATQTILNLDKEVKSKEVLLQEVDGAVVMEKGKDKKIYPASMTKVMTAILAIELLPDLESTFEIPYEMYDDLYTADASLAGFSPDEEVKYIDLLYGVMLPSGADASKAIALAIGDGNEQNFIAMMNEKAKELNMNDTNFMNESGLHNENHYSTVHDMYTLLNYAIKNNVFFEIISTDEYYTSSSNKRDEGLHFESTLFYHLDDRTFSGGKILGGKTGYTEEAGQCLATVAIKNNKKYILVTAGADVKGTNAQLHIQDALTIYGSGF